MSFAVGVSNWRTFVYQLPPVTSEVRLSPPWHLSVSAARLLIFARFQQPPQGLAHRNELGHGRPAPATTPGARETKTADLHPESYWTTPSDPLEAILRNVKGRSRREMIRDYSAAKYRSNQHGRSDEMGPKSIPLPLSFDIVRGPR
jgi:hypothetical protein